MEKEADFWTYLLIENVNFLLRKQEDQGIHTNIISIDEIVREVINQVSKTADIKIDNESINFVQNLLQEKGIGTTLWEIKKGYVVPITSLADIFLKKAEKLFSEERKRFQSVLSIDELIREVIVYFSIIIRESIADENKNGLLTIFDRICAEYKYFRKIKKDYVIFDENGRNRLKELTKL